MVTDLERKSTGGNTTEDLKLYSNKELVQISLSLYLLTQSLSVQRHLSPSFHHVLVLEPNLATPQQMNDIQVLLDAIKNNTLQVTLVTQLSELTASGNVVVTDTNNTCVWFGESAQLPNWLSNDGRTISPEYRTYLVA